MIDLIWDMETNDPDDFLTLLWLLGHPGVHLQAVTIMPGTPDQIGLVRRTVREWFGREDVPIGAYQMAGDPRHVSPWHYEAFGIPAPSTEALPGGEVILAYATPETTLLCGAPLKNLERVLQLEREQGHDLRLAQLVIQGGFAGVGVAPPELQLPQFRGLTTCPPHNVNGSPQTARAISSAKG